MVDNDHEDFVPAFFNMQESLNVSFDHGHECVGVYVTSLRYMFNAHLSCS